MKTIKLILAIFASLMFMVATASCGGDENSNGRDDNAYSDNREADLSEYVGKWVIFEPGDLPGESATFTLNISRNGDVKILLTACPGMGQRDVVLVEGSGKAQLDGTRLYVDLTKGKSRGNSYQFVAKNKTIYTSDGQTFYRK